MLRVAMHETLEKVNFTLMFESRVAPNAPRLKSALELDKMA
jgi:hypothetical protein